MASPEARAALRLARVAGQVALGLALAALAPRLAPAQRDALVRRWARATLQALGVGLVSNPPPSAPGLVVANHVSWLDVLAIAAAHPAAFVAKREVRRWPVVGALAARTGTIFIDRRRTRDVTAANAAILRRLRDGHAVAVFPEGTTTDGSTVLAFRSALIEPARAARVPVHPVAISYRDSCGGLSPDAPFTGDDGFVASLVRIARSGGIAARLEFLEPVSPADLPRHAVADTARERIAFALGT